MTYTLTIDQKPSYLHAIVTGRNSKENVARCLDEIRRECAARACFRVLLEERLEGPRLGTADVFEIATEGSSKARGMIEAMAYVDAHGESASMKFAENVAVNRGMPVVRFSTVAEAERWLLGEDRAPAGQNPAAVVDKRRG